MNEENGNCDPRNNISNKYGLQALNHPQLNKPQFHQYIESQSKAMELRYVPFQTVHTHTHTVLIMCKRTTTCDLCCSILKLKLC